MGVILHREQTTRIAQMRGDVRVRVEDELAGEMLHLGGELTVIPHGAIDFEAVFEAGLIVLAPVAGRGVHDARSLLESHVIGQHDQRVALNPGMARAQALDFSALKARHLLERGARPLFFRQLLEPGQEVLMEYQEFVPTAEHAVFQRRAERQRQVGGQRPGRRRPDEDAHLRTFGGLPQTGDILRPACELLLGDGKFHIDARRGDFLILDFRLGQRRSQARRPVHGF